MVARLPTPGGDPNTWGNVLNDYLQVSLNGDGTLQTSALQQAGGVTSVNSKTPSGGAVTLAASDVGALSQSTADGRYVQLSAPITAAVTDMGGQVFNVKAYGAAGNGTTDDSTHIQTAINDAQAVNGVVFFPTGTYLHNTELSVTAAIRLTGAGATILSTSCAGINFQNTYISAASSSSTTTGLEIDHLVFDVTGGHVFYNTNFNKFSLHDLRLVERSANYAIWYSSNASANQLTGFIYNVVSRVYGATRTVPAWYVLSSIGGGMAFVTVMNCLFQNNDLDATQYYVWFEGTGTHNYTNGIRFIQCIFDSAYGGCVKVLSTQACFFESCNVVDTYTTTPGNSMYYVGASTGGSQWASQKISFRDCNRDLQGPNGSTTWDIYLESTTDSVTIDTYEVRDIPGTSVFYPYFNFNHCTNVTVINCNGAVVTNAATSGVTIGPSGNVSLTGSITGATTPNIPLPSDNAFIAWSFDPVNIAGMNALSVGALTLVAVYIRTTTTISNIVMLYGTTTGATLTNSYAGLYNSSGVLLSGSADQSASWVGASGNGTAKTTALTTPQVVSPGFYWAAAMIGSAGTSPTWGRGGTNPSGLINIGLGANAYRFATYSSALTALPASFTPTSLVNAGATFWVAVK